MPTTYSLIENQKKIIWEPTRSTPSCNIPVKELPEIIDKLKENNVKSLVDLGSGNGRNSKILLKHFDLTMVECGRNVHILKQNENFRKCIILSFEDFQNNGHIKYNAFIICYVFHTIPKIVLRESIINLVSQSLTDDGILCIVSPRNDSKYTCSKLSGYKKHNNGIIKTYPDGKFSFYENLKQSTIIELVQSAGFCLSDKIISRKKNILFFKMNSNGN